MVENTPNVYLYKVITEPNPIMAVAEDVNNSIFSGSINGEIEDTQQGRIGDCWLLTYFNGLRDTKWGKKLIKDAIRPDGNDGAIVTFRGSRGEQKEFQIPIDEIIKAKEKGIYSSGDDDMLIMEIAVEKYLIKYGELYEDRDQNIGTATGEAITGNGLKAKDFVELLSGKQTKSHYSSYAFADSFEDYEKINKEQMRLLNEFEKHPNEYMGVISFRGDSLDGVMYSEHAYQIKKIVTRGQDKYAIIVNPWDSGKTEEIAIDKLLYNTSMICITENPDAKPNQKLNTDIEIMSNNADTIIEMLQNAKTGNVKDTDIEKLKTLAQTANADNIKDIFKSDFEIKFIIRSLDYIKRGWGNGEAKKELIAPLVDAYCEYAKNEGVSEEIINNVKSSCHEELDALLYTNEKVIVENLTVLFNEIAEANKNPLKKLFKFMK